MTTDPTYPVSPLDLVLMGTGIAAAGLASSLIDDATVRLTPGGFAQALGECRPGTDAIVVIIEPDFSRVEELAGMVEQSPVPVIAIAVQPTETMSMRLLRAGVSGCLMIDDRPAEIALAIRSACDGGLPLNPQAGRWLLKAWNNRRAHEEMLSARSIEVLELVAAGMANKQIARRLRISEGTVKAHLTKIFAQIRVTTRTGAAMWYQANRDHLEPTPLRSAS